MRLDQYVAERLCCTRTRAANIVKTGGVTVNGKSARKAGQEVSERDSIEISDTVKFSSLGGVKLDNALKTFSVDLAGKECLDIGAANGGFTHCMLLNGAKSVSAVDITVAFPEELSADPRVRIYDGVNVKDIGSLLPESSFDLITVDLSFISLVGLFSVFYPLLKDGGDLIVLYKPQFEVGKKALPKSGVVHSEKESDKALARVIKSAEECGFHYVDACPIPEFFANKNKERTVLFRK